MTTDRNLEKPQLEAASATDAPKRTVGFTVSFVITILVISVASGLLLRWAILQVL